MPKEPFEFLQSSYKQVLIPCMQSYFKKLKYRLAEETMFFLLVIKNLCGEACFCVKPKTNSRFM